MTEPTEPLSDSRAATDIHSEDTADAYKQILRHCEDTRELVQEVAEDMEGILQFLRRLEQKQDTLETRLEQTNQQIYGNTQVQARELNKLRQELLDEQGSTMGVSLFNMVISTLDNLYVMLNNLESDNPLNHQVQGVVAMIESMLRAVRISAFLPEPGEAFDPQRMRSDGFEESDLPGVVRTSKRGYLIHGKVLREASVVVSQPGRVND